MAPRTTLNPGLALNYVAFRAAINLDGFVAKNHTPSITENPWRRGPCKVHGSHELHIVRGAPGPTRTDGLRIRSPTLYPTELRALGVSEGTRTPDHWGHNPVLYPTELHSPSIIDQFHLWPL